MKKNFYVFLIIILILNAFMPLYFVFTKADVPTSESVAYDTSSYVYLSDIEYDKEETKTAWQTIAYDKTPDNRTLTLNLDDSTITFKKGIFAHASSDVVYNLSGYDYDYFTAYLGIDYSEANKGNGVKFYIYTSPDGHNWELKSNDNPETIRGEDNAKYIEVDIRNAKYLKLSVVDNGSNSNDYAIYGDAKLIKESYQEYKSNFKTIADYDTYLKNNYEANKTNMTEEYELALLQREFINNIGFSTLEFMMGYDKNIEETVNWLMNDLKTLRLFIVGGNPDGNASYGSSLDILSKLYAEYKNDLNDYTPTTYYTSKNLSTYYNKTKGDLYRTMMLSLALTHADNVSLWLDDTQVSDALNRYAIYKELYNDNKLDNMIFESLTVEEMRLVMNNSIDDEEIKWLNDYTQKELNPYNFVAYNNEYNYLDAKYYKENEYKTWDSKYNLDAYNIKMSAEHPKLWIVFEEGGLDGAISKTGANIASSLGIPSIVIGQPGHIAYLLYNVNSEGTGSWSISNNITGWATSGRTEKLGLRMPNSWGEYEYATYTSDIKPDSYIILAQDALNEYDKYEKAEELLLLTNIFQDDNNKLLEIYENTLNTEDINFDAWNGLIDLYRKTNKSEAEWYYLAERITNTYKYYPLPMHDLLRQIADHLTSNEYIVKYANLHESALTNASKITSSDYSNAEITNEIANALLKNSDDTIASFSFEGASAKAIVLGNLVSSTTSWEYSLDGGYTWQIAENKIQKLSNEEINTININNKIKVHLIGTDYSASNIYTINIEKLDAPTNLYGNDLENRVIGADSSMEWRYTADEEWTSYGDASPDLRGDVSVEVRYQAEGISLASDSVTFTFTQDNESEIEKYIPVSELSVYKVSSEATSNDGYAKYAIDGNLNTAWHSNWNGQDSSRYIIIKLEHSVSLTALEYIPIPDDNNGRIKTGTISVSTDGESFREIKSISWSDDESTKKEQFEAIEAQYIKIQATSNYGDGRNFITASMINLYRDASKDKAPTASISYDTTEVTNQNVIVRLVNPSTNITITNNNGNDTYTFTKNGEFTFEFKDDNGNKGTATAKVDWIDKDVPTAEVIYSPNNLTSKEVVATLTNFSEEVTILNNYDEEGNENNKADTYIFTANGEFVFRFQDKAGNIGTARAYVNWIDKGAALGTIEYDINELTNDSVKATLKCNEGIIILNNNGNSSYTFTKNGTFQFIYQDIAGNVSITEASVDWITNEILPNTNNENYDSNNDIEDNPISDSNDANLSDDIIENEDNLNNEDNSDSVIEDSKEDINMVIASSAGKTDYINNSNESSSDTSNSVNNNRNTKMNINLTNSPVSNNKTSSNHNSIFIIIFITDLFLSSIFIYSIIDIMKEEKERFSN